MSLFFLLHVCEDLPLSPSPCPRIVFFFFLSSFLPSFPHYSISFFFVEKKRTERLGHARPRLVEQDPKVSSGRG